jgi:hypothetical protein
MKHGYGNLGAVPVPGTAEVRVQPGYRCMRTPFFPKKKNFQVRVGYELGTGWVWARLKVAKNYVVFQQNYSTLSLSLYHPPSAATLTSSAYRRRCTVSSDLDLWRQKISGVLRFGRAASFFLSGFLLFSLGIFLSLRWA